ncbi:protein WVD2-like 7 isoform X2 [Humulus lupulus]|uniref:protein WVD2-like 7 isoform X2 n=1 Tax=Humulus lupulus TaxID=3486 RepID=UPI002B41782B|nr:protein WVD2-like 7 isoform X2 [Humulus lupulus]
MGESIVDLPIDSDKMGETNASHPVLDVSVSFGRFENDSLSWEKWSAFSPNKYLEEVEKCATPGSVAQKKAYFEAHYRKIAARKAELLEQEKQAQNDFVGSEDPNGRDLITDNNFTHHADAEYDESEDLSSAEEVKQEASLTDEEDFINGLDLKEDVITCQESENPVVERGEELDIKGEAAVLVKEEEDIEVGSQVNKEVLECKDNELGYDSKGKEENVKSDKQNESQKVTATNKERNVGSVKKKQASPITRTPKSSSARVSKPILNSYTPKHSKPIPSSSTPKVSKPIPCSSTSKVSKSIPSSNTAKVSKPTPNSITSKVSKAISSSSTSKVSRATSSSGGISVVQSLAKKGSSNTPFLQRNTNPSDGETKKFVSNSLHMSLSLGPTNTSTNSDSPTVTTIRKSLFMEKMGDKDIVKRAFKAFQKNFDQLKSNDEDGSPLQKQMQGSTNSTAPNVSTSMTPRKENGGSLRTERLDKQSAKTPPSSFRPKSVERIERRKEEKSNAGEADKANLQSRSKEQKEAELKKLRQNHNFKASPMPAFNRGQKMSKSTSEKMSSKSEIR